MSVRPRGARFVGVASIVIGVGAMIYAHTAVKPDLQRTEDVARRLVVDAAFAVAELQRAAEATDAVRPPTEGVTRQSVAALGPGLAMLDALAETLHTIPGTDETATSGVGKLARRVLPGSNDDAEQRKPGLGESLALLERAVTAATHDVRALRRASLAMETAVERHPMPSFQRPLATLAERVAEMQAILADTRPARGVTMLADLIAGVYVMLGLALLTVGGRA